MRNIIRSIRYHFLSELGLRVAVSFLIVLLIYTACYIRPGQSSLVEILPVCFLACCLVLYFGYMLSISGPIPCDRSKIMVQSSKNPAKANPLKIGSRPDWFKAQIDELFDLVDTSRRRLNNVRNRLYAKNPSFKCPALDDAAMLISVLDNHLYKLTEAAYSIETLDSECLQYIVPDPAQIKISRKFKSMKVDDFKLTLEKVLAKAEKIGSKR